MAVVTLIAVGGGWASFLLAGYGAMVATAVAVYQFTRDRPGVKLITSRLYFVAFREGDEDEDEDREIGKYYNIRIINHRKRPITIREAGLLNEDGYWLRPEAFDVSEDAIRPVLSPLPATLTDGMSIEIHLEIPDDEEVIGAWVVDDLDRTYKSYEPSRNPLRRKWDVWRAMHP